MSVARINTKSECYELYEQGLLGNKPLTWHSYQEILKSGWKGDVCIRSKKPIPRDRVKYNVPIEKIMDEIKEFKERGAKEEELTFNQAMSDEKLLIQGELMNYFDGMNLLYSRVKKPMNLALRENQEYAIGLKAKLILRHFLYPSSYSDIETLLENFPDSAIEFSTYSIPVGNIPGRNTIIWEVRNY